MSIDDVASSRTIILGREMMARERHKSWRWPCERLRPPAATGLDSVSFGLATVAVAVALDTEEVSDDASVVAVVVVTRWERSSASRSCASVHELVGSRFERIVPEKRTGSCPC